MSHAGKSVQIFQQIGMHGRIGGKRVPAALCQIVAEKPGALTFPEKKMFGRRPDEFSRRQRLSGFGRMQQPAVKIRHFSIVQADNRAGRAEE